MDRHKRVPLLLQGGYYLVTGVWPLVHRRSFEAVTGPKQDRFVLDAAGALFVAIGASLIAGARDPGPSTRATAVATPAAAAVAAWRHRRTVRPVYFADAILQALLGTWSLRSTQKPPTHRRALERGGG